MDIITNKILEIMIKYNGTDVKRINHALKVFAFAQYIGIKENCSSKEQSIIEYSSILHDIGIHEAEKKYNSSSGKHQEELGPDIAKNLIGYLKIPDEIKERVYYLIGNHHTYNKIDGIDFQVLVEIGYLKIPDEIKERVYYLIGNHHTYNKIDGIDFQILVEADFMVNIFEDNINNIISIKNKIFKTKTGIELLDTMYLNNRIVHEKMSDINV